MLDEMLASYEELIKDVPKVLFLQSEFDHEWRDMQAYIEAIHLRRPLVAAGTKLASNWITDEELKSLFDETLPVLSASVTMFKGWAGVTIEPGPDEIEDEDEHLRRMTWCADQKDSDGNKAIWACGIWHDVDRQQEHYFFLFKDRQTAMMFKLAEQ
jgi:hypothetical protein